MDHVKAWCEQMSDKELASWLEAGSRVQAEAGAPSTAKLMAEAARRLRRPSMAELHRESSRVPERFQTG